MAMIKPDMWDWLVGLTAVSAEQQLGAKLVGDDVIIRSDSEVITLLQNGAIFAKVINMMGGAIGEGDIQWEDESYASLSNFNLIQKALKEYEVKLDDDLKRMCVNGDTDVILNMMQELREKSEKGAVSSFLPKISNPDNVDFLEAKARKRRAVAELNHQLSVSHAQLIDAGDLTGIHAVRQILSTLLQTHISGSNTSTSELLDPAVVTGPLPPDALSILSLSSSPSSSSSSSLGTKPDPSPKVGTAANSLGSTAEQTLHTLLRRGGPRVATWLRDCYANVLSLIPHLVQQPAPAPAPAAA
eukprot:CAMPEP_0175124248 /NCGR_PEP_ID=MMETSP0087-20121206/2679_1 /TAXON_ID=136419 /ORGANISM="Unknown Unknown, Strain D1" /LENGTH=299 /DNA_ID=CAMNT_0016406001 /DNA_START=72 /DNA_END=968 /DNA_ORIENTATION=-